MLIANVVFCVAVAFVAGINLYFGPRIAGDRMAMQWGTDGSPTWSAPKHIALWGTAAFMLAVRAMIWALSTYAPEKIHGADIGVLVFSLTVAASHGFVVRKAMRA